MHGVDELLMDPIGVFIEEALALLPPANPTAEDAVLGDLVLRSYYHNRLQFPQIQVEQWRKVYGNSVDIMEPRFQKESRDEITYEEFMAGEL